MFELPRKFFLAAIVAGFLIAAPGGRSAMAGMIIDLDPSSSDSVKLSELIDGTHDGISVGDKVFDDFVYSVIGDMPVAEDVNVLGFTDLNGNYGFTLHGVFLDLPGGGASDALLRYSVSLDEAAEAAGRTISAAHLFLSGVGIGPNSGFIVDESFQGLNNTMTVFSVEADGQEEKATSAWTFFDPTRKKLRVTKDILAFTGEGTILPARATAIDQSFSQEIPEPATLSLLAMSLIGTLFVSRQRQRVTTN